MISALLHVALGGAVGSVLRYLAVQALGAPMATLVVNVLGSFAIGVLFVVLGPKMQYAPLLMAGLLGGFTTFSSFSLDTLRLVEAGHILQAAAYVAGTVLLSLIAVALGVALARGLA
ncbi:MAG: CrcB family protein [Rhodobacterales bacterium]|nr:CrcB family protein [Rhodobacterales bacterium]